MLFSFSAVSLGSTSHTVYLHFLCSMKRKNNDTSLLSDLSEWNHKSFTRMVAEKLLLRP